MTFGGRLWPTAGPTNPIDRFAYWHSVSITQFMVSSRSATISSTCYVTLWWLRFTSRWRTESPDVFLLRRCPGFCLPAIQFTRKPWPGLSGVLTYLPVCSFSLPCCVMSTATKRWTSLSRWTCGRVLCHMAFGLGRMCLELRFVARLRCCAKNTALPFFLFVLSMICSS